jgi:intracellular multiplication protein IcmD
VGKHVLSYKNFFSTIKRWLKVSWLTALFYSTLVLAEGGPNAGGAGEIATRITAEFEGIGKLILAVAFLAGIGFIMAAIFKFKQHKDTPQQVTLGQPIALLIIGVFLAFLPSLFGPAGTSVFGTSKVAGGFLGGGATTIPGASS